MTIPGWIPFVVSVLAPTISALTAWLTLIRRGTVRATKPAVIYFGHDSAGFGPPKVFLRTLLYSTAKRGRVIESMYATLKRGDVRQSFHTWVYGDKPLLRGSGLFVGDTGVAANHHFMNPNNETQFQFDAGRYTLEVLAQLVGDRSAVTLFSQELEVTSELALALEDHLVGLYWDWGPTGRYVPHIDKRGVAPSPEELIKLLGSEDRDTVRTDRAATSSRQVQNGQGSKKSFCRPSGVFPIADRRL